MGGCRISCGKLLLPIYVGEGIVGIWNENLRMRNFYWTLQ